MSEETELVDVVETDSRLARAWYVKYPFDSMALGPLRFSKPVNAEEAVEDAVEAYNEKPSEVWPTGPVEDVEEYEFTVSHPKSWN